jgi:hypothetical protein
MGFILTAFTLFHVVISLAGILSGFVVAAGLLNSKRLDGWTTFFLATTIATSVTGFFFPVHHFMPSHAVGILSLVLLAIALVARYQRRLAGPWRWIYVITAMLAQYLNVFVLIVQSFAKIPSLKSLAPTQTEPPFKITQLIVLVIFIAFIVIAAKRFHPKPAGSI